MMLKSGFFAICLGLTILFGSYAHAFPVDSTVHLPYQNVDFVMDDTVQFHPGDTLKADKLNGMLYQIQRAEERLSKIEDEVFTKTRQAVTAEDNDQNKVIAEQADKIDKLSKAIGKLSVRLSKLEHPVKK